MRNKVVLFNHMSPQDIVNCKISKILKLPYLKPYRELLFGPGKGRCIDWVYVGKDYVNDLNAMDKVYQWLNQNGDGSDNDLLLWEGRRDQYGYFLEQRYKEIRRKTGGSVYILANLSAKDKAECFLKAMKDE